MREAIGSTWLIGIVITFIAIFSGFLAYSISYTKAFRVKNEIINIIEKNEGFSSSKKITDVYNVNESDLKDDNSTEAKAFKFIKSIGYDYGKFNEANPCKEGNLRLGGYCLVKYCPDNGASTRMYYKVTTYISLSIPVINIGINLPVTGETKALIHDTGKYPCDVGGI